MREGIGISRHLKVWRPRKREVPNLGANPLLFTTVGDCVCGMIWGIVWWKLFLAGKVEGFSLRYVLP